MSRHSTLQAHLTSTELEQRYRSAGPALLWRLWRRGSASALAVRSSPRWATPICSASSTASGCPGDSISKPIQQRRSGAKKERATAA